MQLGMEVGVAVLVGLVLGYLYGCVSMVAYVEWEGWRPPDLPARNPQRMVELKPGDAGSNPAGPIGRRPTVGHR